MNRLRTVGLSAMFGLAAVSCGTGSEALTVTTDDETSQEVALHRFEPSEASAEAFHTQEDDEARAQLVYTGGMFACNGADIQMVETDDGSYDMSFRFNGSLDEQHKLQLAEDVELAIDLYEQETGSHDIGVWFEEFESVHKVFFDNHAEYCELILD